MLSRELEQGSSALRDRLICVYYNLKDDSLIEVIDQLKDEMNLEVKPLNSRDIKTSKEVPVKIVISEKLTSSIRKMLLEGSDDISAILLATNLNSLSEIVELFESKGESNQPILEVIVTQNPLELKMRMKIIIVRALKEKFIDILTQLEKLEGKEDNVRSFLGKVKNTFEASNLFTSIGIAYVDPHSHIIEPIADIPKGFLKNCKYKEMLKFKELSIQELGSELLIVFPLIVEIRDEAHNFGVILLKIPKTISNSLSSSLLESIYKSILKGLDRAYHKEMLNKVFSELSAIYDVSISFTSVKSLKDLLKMIVRKAKTTLQGDVASLMLLDHETQLLKIEYAEGLPPEVVHSARQKLGEGIAGKVALTGKAMLIVDADEEPIEISEVEKGIKSAISVPLKSSDDRILGVLNVSKVSPFRFSDEDKHLLFNLATLAANAIEKTKLYEDLKSSYQELEETYMSVIAALSRAFEAKDRYHKGHMEKVAKYAMAIAIELDPRLLLDDSLRLAAMFHDLGKIAIPDEILHKPSKLTDEEYEIIKTHPEAGEVILTPLKFLKKVAKIVRHHQERWDGKGYPDGLKGEEIPLEARIIAVADAFDAMTSNRPYRKAMPVEEAVQEILRNSGTQFDPKVVDAFYRAYKKGLIP